MPFGLQPIHLIVVAIAALLIFGPSKLPEIGRGVGRAITEFRRGAKEMSETFMDEVHQPDEEQPQAAVNAGVPITAPAEVVQPYGANGTQAVAAVNAQPVETAEAQGNFCIHCGNSNPGGAVYCNRCGSKIAE